MRLIADGNAVKKLKYSFSRVTWRVIAPLFNMDPDDASLSQLGVFEAERSWLPLDVVKKTCSDMDVADVQYGQMIQHNNEEARNRYISTVSVACCLPVGVTDRVCSCSGESSICSVARS